MSRSVDRRYIVGLDLGQANDYTSLVVLKPNDAEDPVFTAGHIERVPLNTRYPAIVSHTKDVVTALRQPIETPQEAVHMVGGHGFARPPKRPHVTLVVDFTGVGRPVADMLIDADLDCQVILVTITGGDTAIRSERGEWRVPKRDLASVIQRLLQEGRLEIPADHPMAATLTTELTGFRVKISLTGHDSYGAGEDWRSAPHDDLVLGLALACWWADRPVPQVRIL